MRAMILEKAGTPLKLVDLPIPEPGPGQVLLRVQACGVCRTDLHILDRELSQPKLPLVMGHQVVGVVEKLGPGANQFQVGARVGVPWLGKTCGTCRFCTHGQENLCPNALFTGYTQDGGFAEYMTAYEQFCFPIPASYPALQAAPLLCAGLIGYRAYRFAGEAQVIGFYGFGSAAHILCQVAVHQGKKVFAFTRPGDEASQQFALSLGAAWAGVSGETPPEPLEAAIIFAPAGGLVPLALQVLRPGGKVVCAGIHMSDIPSFPYSLLWEERSIQSVANLSRQDGLEFLELAPAIPVQTEVHPYPLGQANQALDDLRHGRFNGSAVILPGE